MRGEGQTGNQIASQRRGYVDHMIGPCKQIHWEGLIRNLYKGIQYIFLHALESNRNLSEVTELSESGGSFGISFFDEDATIVKRHDVSV